MDGRARALAVIMIAAFLALVPTAGAWAVFTENTLDCSASATITNPDGTTYEVNATDEEVELPRQGDAEWMGETEEISVNHAGAVRAVFGPFSPQLGSWSSPNEKQAKAADGSRSYDIPDWVPPFALTVEGEHDAKGDESRGIPPGRCAGYVDVILLGEWTDSIVAMVIVGLTGLTTVVFLASGITRRPR